MADCGVLAEHCTGKNARQRTYATERPSRGVLYS